MRKELYENNCQKGKAVLPKQEEERIVKKLNQYGIKKANRK